MNNADELIGRLARRLATAPAQGLDDAINETLAVIGLHTMSDRVYLTQFHRDDTIEIEHEWLDPNLAPHRVAVGVTQASNFAYSVELARAGQRCETSDIDTLPAAAYNEQQSFAAFGVKAILQVPVAIDGHVIGVLGFNSQTSREWSTLDSDLIEWTTEALAVALQRRAAAADVARATADADLARRSARNLVGRFSHELRTPLHVILGYTELLQLKAEQPDDAAALAHIEFNGRRLLSLIDDLLIFDDEDSDGVTVVRLSDVLDEVIEAIGSVAAQREVSIEVDADDDVEVWFDRGRLRQVLYCQLAATVQDTPPGARVRYSLNDIDDAAEVTMRVTGNDEDELSVVAMPLAEALLADEAELVVDQVSDHEWTAQFTLPSVASPAGDPM